MREGGKWDLIISYIIDLKWKIVGGWKTNI